VAQTDDIVNLLLTDATNAKTHTLGGKTNLMESFFGAGSFMFGYLWHLGPLGGLAARAPVLFFVTKLLAMRLL